jgi:hypothetical protein
VESQGSGGRGAGVEPFLSLLSEFQVFSFVVLAVVALTSGPFGLSFLNFRFSVPWFWRYSGAGIVYLLTFTAKFLRKFLSRVNPFLSLFLSISGLQFCGSGGSGAGIGPCIRVGR